ncbi:unnamed protein product [Pleuronectes platessa]|uniref:Uncharacterized protein n=1 Tax=Pleuronectes platessa TaxID=8262 RepID=A0A9N7UJM6_PLEPL|nr:unnamed protein product [Pleuronectes platessa]
MKERYEPKTDSLQEEVTDELRGEQMELEKEKKAPGARHDPGSRQQKRGATGPCRLSARLLDAFKAKIDIQSKCQSSTSSFVRLVPGPLLPSRSAPPPGLLGPELSDEGLSRSDTGVVCGVGRVASTSPAASTHPAACPSVTAHTSSRTDTDHSDQQQTSN